MILSEREAVTLLEKNNARLDIMPGVHPRYLTVDAKRKASLTPYFFAYEDQGEVFYHGFHLAPIPGTSYFDLQSPYGYGGPVATTTDGVFLELAWKNYQTFCQKKKVVVEFIRFHPLLKNWQYYQGETMFNRDTVWIDLEVDDLLASYPQNRVRTAVRKGMKNNVQITFPIKNDFLPHFKKLYRDSMLRMGTDSFYLFNDDYIEALCDWNKAFLVIAMSGQEVVATLLGLIVNETLELHLFGASEASKSSCATNLIYHEAFLKAKEQGCHKVHFGGGASAEEGDPLLFFKLGYSKRVAEYRIGKFVHDPQVYEELIVNFAGKEGKKPARVLFYRENS